MSSLSQRGSIQAQKAQCKQPKTSNPRNKTLGKTRRTRARRNRPGQRPPWLARGDHHSPWWQPRPVVAATGRGGPSPSRLLRFCGLLRFFTRGLFGCCQFLALKWRMYLDIGEPNSLHRNYLLHSLSFGVSFRERKKERRRIARISYQASIERWERVFWMSFSFPSPLFSQSKFMFCCLI